MKINQTIRYMAAGLMIFLFIAPGSAYAQFDRLLKRKLEREVSNMLAEKAAEIIARKAAQKLESAMDDWIEESMKQDSSYAGGRDDSTYYRSGRAYGEFLKGMNDAASLRDKYEFDISLLVELSENGQDPETMLMHYSKSEALFATEAVDDKQRHYMVIDVENDVVVMFEEDKKGRKTAQALPNFSKLAGRLGKSAANVEKYSIAPIKKGKKINGYKCKGFKGESDTQAFESWITEEIDINLNASYMALVEKFAPESTSSMSFEDMTGVLMSSESWEKEEPDKKYIWETKEVIQEPFAINPSEYELGATFD